MGAVGLVGALTDPQHVRRAVVPVAGEAVLAGQRLFVAEDQRLVAREDVDLAEVGVVLGVDAAGAHEAQRPVDLAGDVVVALALRARRDELLVPRVDAAEGGEAALGERPQQVQRRRRLVVRLDEAVRVGHPHVGERARVVDDVAAEHRQLDVADALGGTRARLGELTGDATDLDDRDTHRVRHHDGHLQDDPELLADVVGGELLEALGAVTGLQQEGVAGGDLGERRLQRPRLAGEHERREAGDRLEGAVQLIAVGPVRLLLRRAVLPRRRRPRLHEREAYKRRLTTSGRRRRGRRGRSAPARRRGRAARMNATLVAPASASAATWAATSSAVPIAPSSTHQSSGAPATPSTPSRSAKAARSS